jgi:cytidine deaminase
VAVSPAVADADLFTAAEAVRARAYAPYSKFAVGAAILADDGNIYAGCNIENAAYPQGNCAEASAIAAMIAGGAKRILRIYVTGPGTAPVTPCGGCRQRIRRLYVTGPGTAPVTPCGGCRQRIREFADLDVVVISHGIEGAPLTQTLNQLLPHSFGPEFLSK